MNERQATLQKYFDGELSENEAELFATELDGSAESRTELQGLEKLRSAMRTAAETWSHDLDSAALFDDVMRSIDQERSRPPLRVIRGSERPAIRGGIALGLAAAAAVLIAVLSWPSSDQKAVTSGGVQLAARGSEVEEVDFGTNTGTVFAVEGAAGQPLAVVWINDEEIGYP